jgi:hypothetical protein
MPFAIEGYVDPGVLRNAGRFATIDKCEARISNGTGRCSKFGIRRSLLNWYLSPWEW